MKTSWPASRVIIPLILFRVVWGTGETIETFSPQILFKSVDFPAEGRPIIDTNADFIALL
jgi:hypothetical protein